MTKDLLIILVLLFLNLAGAIIFFLFHLRKKAIKRGAILTAFFLVAPIWGFILVFVGELINLLVHQARIKKVLTKELSFSKKRAKFVTDPDIQKELDTVPIEEAILVSGKQDRRQAFLDVLKNDDYEQIMDNISGAVGSEDQEISHYAAAFVTDTLAKYKSREAELRKMVEDSRTVENMLAYISYMADIIDKNLFSIIELRKYMIYLDETASSLFLTDHDKLSDTTLSLLINNWKKAGSTDRYSYWISVSRKRCRYSLICFKMCMEQYYESGDKNALFMLLDDIKSSSINLDSESLDWIRFFSSQSEEQ